MNFSKLLLALAASGFVSSAFATNGDVLIGLGAQSRAMGGTGTAAFFGSENALTNPALIAKSKGTEFSIGGTFFMPDVQASSNITGATATKTSDADLSMIPEVSLSTRINDDWTFGLGMFGSAGMGVDFRGNGGLFEAYTNLQLMKFAPTLAYNKGNFGIGFAPVLQYGSLDINYNNPAGPGNVGSGASSDLAWGFNLGGYMDVTPNLTLGLAYQSAIKMHYKNQIANAANNFGLVGMFSDHLEQPAEIKAGVAYTTGPWMVTGDYKRIQWSSAEGYKQFNWKDQDVFALGMKYSQKGYWVGVGYNHGKDPIEVLPQTTAPNQTINMFNNLMFPGIVEDHYTLGGGVALGEHTTLDMALTYAGEVSKTVNTGIIGAPTSTETTTHSQLGATIAVRMNF